VNARTPNRYHPEGNLSLLVEDTDTYQLVAAARELEAHLLHEQACHLADVRALLVELYQRDGVAVDDATLDAQADEVAAQERAERFLEELVPAFTLARSCWNWPASSTTTALECGGRQPPASRRPAHRICCRGGCGWRRSSAASCAATRTWSEPKPTSAERCATTAW
jgi:hypothetical protein